MERVSWRNEANKKLNTTAYTLGVVKSPSYSLIIKVSIVTSFVKTIVDRTGVGGDSGAGG